MRVCVCQLAPRLESTEWRCQCTAQHFPHKRLHVYDSGVEEWQVDSAAGRHASTFLSSRRRWWRGSVKAGRLAPFFRVKRFSLRNFGFQVMKHQLLPSLSLERSSEFLVVFFRRCKFTHNYFFCFFFVFGPKCKQASEWLSICWKNTGQRGRLVAAAHASFLDHSSGGSERWWARFGVKRFSNVLCQQRLEVRKWGWVHTESGAAMKRGGAVQQLCSDSWHVWLAATAWHKQKS